jgi:hypothetical protein
MLPSKLMTQPPHPAELASWLETQDTQGLRHHHALLLIIRWRHAFEHLEAFHGRLATGCLVGNHAADGLVEDARGSTEMEGTWRSEIRVLILGL